MLDTVLDSLSTAAGVPVRVARAAAHTGPLPLCLFLFGGGGDESTLDAIAPILDAAWERGALAPMIVACAGVPPFCFYLDDDARDQRHESTVADDLVAAVRSRFALTERLGLVGISMGGYGALKIAFARPGRFHAVAAVAPMVEPAVTSAGAPPRNRFFYPPGAPAALVGADRDEALFAADHPINRLVANADRLRAADLPIYLDAGSRDALCAHDGAELIHRVLWELDLPHEYVLSRDGDHVGPTIAPRLERAFAWVGSYLSGALPDAPGAEQAALRAAIEPARAQAAAADPTLDRVYGVLPDAATIAAQAAAS